MSRTFYSSSAHTFKKIISYQQKKTQKKNICKRTRDCYFPKRHYFCTKKTRKKKAMNICKRELQQEYDVAHYSTLIARSLKEEALCKGPVFWFFFHSIDSNNNNNNSNNNNNDWHLSTQKLMLQEHLLGISLQFLARAIFSFLFFFLFLKTMRVTNI